MSEARGYRKGKSLVFECTGCGADFLATLAIPVDLVLCPACATLQPCGHLAADTVEDLAGQPFCARCLEEPPCPR